MQTTINLLAGLLLTPFLIFTPVSALSVSGSVGSPISGTVLPSASCTSLSYGLGNGSRSASTKGEVTELQNFLYAKGDLSVAATGYFGPLTVRAVEQFQGSHSIATTGFVGSLTRAAIQKESCPSTTTMPPNGGVTISAITPSSGPVGTVVTLGGSGFTSSNIIHFGGGAISNVAASAAVFNCPNMPVGMPAGSTGTCGAYPQILSFTVPSSIGPYCAPGMACPMYEELLTPNTYTVYVQNDNGTSNSVSFTITGTNPLMQQ